MTKLDELIEQAKIDNAYGLLEKDIEQLLRYAYELGQKSLTEPKADIEERQSANHVEYEIGFNNGYIAGKQKGFDMGRESNLPPTQKLKEEVEINNSPVGQTEFIEIEEGYRNNVCPNCDFHYIHESATYCSRCGRKILRLAS